MTFIGAVSGVSGVSGPGAMSGVTAAARALATPESDATGSGSFAATLGRHLDGVQQLQGSADSLAVQAATGDLTDVHDYMIAATQARVATELTVTVRNKAVEAFNEIMRMQA